jgi:hypothetical protein
VKGRVGPTRLGAELGSGESWAEKREGRVFQIKSFSFFSFISNPLQNHFKNKLNHFEFWVKNKDGRGDL